MIIMSDNDIDNSIWKPIRNIGHKVINKSPIRQDIQETRIWSDQDKAETNANFTLMHTTNKT